MTDLLMCPPTSRTNGFPSLVTDRDVMVVTSPVVRPLESRCGSRWVYPWGNHRCDHQCFSWSLYTIVTVVPSEVFCPLIPLFVFLFSLFVPVSQEAFSHIYKLRVSESTNLVFFVTLSGRFIVCWFIFIITTLFYVTILEDFWHLLSIRFLCSIK